jgi:hypothetical protein
MALIDQGTLLPKFRGLGQDGFIKEDDGTWYQALRKSLSRPCLRNSPTKPGRSQNEPFLVRGISLEAPFPDYSGSFIDLVDPKFHINETKLFAFNSIPVHIDGCHSLLLKITHQEESIIAVSIMDSCNATVRVAVGVCHLGRFQVPII